MGRVLVLSCYHRLSALVMNIESGKTDSTPFHAIVEKASGEFYAPTIYWNGHLHAHNRDCSGQHSATVTDQRVGKPRTVRHG